MKINQLLEAIDPALQALITKHGLTANRTGSAIEDFKMTKAIEDEFTTAGFVLHWNAKACRFDVKTSKTIKDEEKKRDIDFAIRNATGRVDGFKPRRKMFNKK